MPTDVRMEDEASSDKSPRTPAESLGRLRRAPLGKVGLACGSPIIIASPNHEIAGRVSVLNIHLRPLLA